LNQAGRSSAGSIHHMGPVGRILQKISLNLLQCAMNFGMFAVKLLNALAETDYCPGIRANNYEEPTLGKSGKFRLCCPFWGVFGVRRTRPVH